MVLRIFHRLFLFFILWLVTLCFHVEAQEKQKKMNILFIAVDDLKPLMSCYGDGFAITPNFDRLAANGMIFANCHCQQAVCAPSRASLLTGLRPDGTGVWDLKTRMRDIHPDLLSLPQHFRNNGYETVGMGKIYDPRGVDSKHDEPSWSRPHKNAWEFPRGKDTPGPEYGYQNPELKGKIREALKAARREGVKGYGKSVSYLKKAGLWLPTDCADVPDDAYGDGAMTNGALKVLAELAGSEKPFFLAVGYSKPHLPFNAPKKYWDMYDREKFKLHPFQKHAENSPDYAYQDSWELRGGYSGIPKGPIAKELQLELIHGYYASVSYIDAQLGKLLDAVEKNGLKENTVIILWGDHGWHLGDHGMFCKHTNFEQATRSPLMISVPGMKNTGAVSKAPTEFVDIYPTMCNLAGLQIPGHVEGISLIPILENPKSSVKAAAISQFPRNVNQKTGMGYTYRGNRFRYTEWMQMKFREGERTGNLDAVEMYDYENDPLETKNIADDPEFAEIRARFEKLARGGWKECLKADGKGL